MRLLHAKTMELRSFQEDEVPEYAILSHTWHDDEVLFEDLHDMDRASKQAGFRKIRFCCEQALKDDIQFVWVDTCCIDKSSSAELSEAINSMFLWYREAKVCYAYLQDVSALVIGNGRIQSRWFERAWTLQELLAPKSLVFYSSDWNFLGTKDDHLQSAISWATGIEVEDLSGKWLKWVSIAKRMSWAARRKATRGEDIAYSLFGIFDVQMPLLYGEGRRKAFLRLQEEIMKSSNDHTLFAWTKRRGVFNPATATMSILAPDPYCFINERRLEPTKKINPSPPYSMTNIGLRISLPLFYKTGWPLPLSTIVVAALNCHIEGDYFQVAALHLRYVGSNQFLRCTVVDSLYLVRTDFLSNFTTKEIFIRNDYEEVEIIDTHYRRRAFILRDLPPVVNVDGHGTSKIREVYPPEFWLNGANVIQGLWIGDKTQSWHACVDLIIDTEKLPRHICLVLGVDVRRGDRPWEDVPPWDEHNLQFSSWFTAFLDPTETLAELHKRDFSRVRENFNGSCEYEGLKTTLNEASGDRDYVPFMFVMEEWTCVVDFDGSIKPR
ncbi:HET-domain-containing protein [Hyaloscypha variabilis F]|uniref:HET-domain-containing protein n=1 Tax=Hyaloscypha variabilis (strain UAMH 11265 / GT02V1 / F) TaxID=1149755 RepID=A0A2J6SE30_HYAVF|nr:HET-domain-containing protein [Hyaloscypha variabilis F]